MAVNYEKECDENKKLFDDVCASKEYSIGMQKKLDIEINRLKKQLTDSDKKMEDIQFENYSLSDKNKDLYDQLRDYYTFSMEAKSLDCTYCAGVRMKFNKLSVQFDKIKDHKVIKSELIQNRDEIKKLQALVKNYAEKDKVSKKEFKQT